MTPKRLEPTTPRSQVKHSSMELPTQYVSTSGLLILMNGDKSLSDAIRTITSWAGPYVSG